MLELKFIHINKYISSEYNNDPCGTDEPCYCCGNPIDNLDKAVWIQLLKNNTIVNTDKEIDGGDFYPVCSSCKIKIPKEFKF